MGMRPGDPVDKYLEQEQRDADPLQAAESALANDYDRIASSARPMHWFLRWSNPDAASRHAARSARGNCRRAARRAICATSAPCQSWSPIWFLASLLATS